MTMPVSPLPLLLLAAVAASAQAGSAPGLLPAGLAPAGLRLQATFAAARPDQGMAVFGQNGHGQLRRAGSDLGNGLQLLRILNDRVILGHGNREYYLPLQAASAEARQRPAVRTARPATPAPGASAAVSSATVASSSEPTLQAGNLDEVRQQCRSSAISQLSAAQRQEIQALGLCP